ncbi:hypothetical protein CHS0354_039210 [Potamilus streckersoni]|uniref:Uncharacterized protein n=1 Tax=Potamilus streckersoni TaxID=2493646 RepID=A0AAE0TD39_9BIVA|nr:hypothetical protein CHS0354_039210 [Potamilus streckersoni]
MPHLGTKIIFKVDNGRIVPYIGGTSDLAVFSLTNIGDKFRKESKSRFNLLCLPTTTIQEFLHNSLNPEKVEAKLFVDKLTAVRDTAMSTSQAIPGRFMTT